MYCVNSQIIYKRQDGNGESEKKAKCGKYNMWQIFVTCIDDVM